MIPVKPKFRSETLPSRPRPGSAVAGDDGVLYVTLDGRALVLLRWERIKEALEAAYLDERDR